MKQHTHSKATNGCQRTLEHRKRPFNLRKLRFFALFLLPLLLPPLATLGPSTRTTVFLLSVIHYPLSTVHCSLSTVHCLLSVGHCLASIARKGVVWPAECPFRGGAPAANVELRARRTNLAQSSAARSQQSGANARFGDRKRALLCEFVAQTSGCKLGWVSTFRVGVSLSADFARLRPAVEFWPAPLGFWRAILGGQADKQISRSANQWPPATGRCVEPAQWGRTQSTVHTIQSTVHNARWAHRGALCCA